jgi:hypothetical protein
MLIPTYLSYKACVCNLRSIYFIKGPLSLFSEWAPTLVLVGTGSLILVGIVLTCALCYYGSVGTLSCFRHLWACLRRFEFELHQPDCACITVHKRRYCPTQEAEKPGEFVHDRRDRQDVDVNPMGSDSDEELNAPMRPPRAMVTRSPRAPRSRNKPRSLKSKVTYLLLF